jgi:hypothetical protein
MGGKALHDIGFIYVIFPSVLSSIIHVAIAVLVNDIPSDPVRQYPAYWNGWQEGQGASIQWKLPSLRAPREAKTKEAKTKTMQPDTVVYLLSLFHLLPHRPQAVLDRA